MRIRKRSQGGVILFRFSASKKRKNLTQFIGKPLLELQPIGHYSPFGTAERGGVTEEFLAGNTEIPFRTIQSKPVGYNIINKILFVPWRRDSGYFPNLDLHGRGTLINGVGHWNEAFCWPSLCKDMPISPPGLWPLVIWRRSLRTITRHPSPY